jgi:hypothetical protein
LRRDGAPTRDEVASCAQEGRGLTIAEAAKGSLLRLASLRQYEASLAAWL